MPAFDSTALVFFVAAVITGFPAREISAQSPPPDIRYQRLSLEEGLSQSTVFASLQDSQGYMWFGTEDGLNRYDGHQFTVYKKRDKDSLSLPDNYITSLLEDAQGNIWAGTYSGGVAVLDRSTGSFKRIVLPDWCDQGIRTNAVMSLTKDTRGNIWAGVWSSGVSRFDPSSRRWTHFRKDTSAGSLIDNRVRYLCADHTGRVWICTFGGLDFYDPSSKCLVHCATATGSASPIRDPRIMCAFEDRDGDLWFGTFEGGLVFFDSRANIFSRTFTANRSPSGLSSDRISAIGQSGDGTLWVGTWDAGVNHVDKKSGLVRIGRRSDSDIRSLSTDAVRSVHRDRFEGMWIGTAGGGVNHFDPERFKFGHLRHMRGDPQSIVKADVRSLCEDRNGALWIGTTGGLDRYDLRTRKYRHYLHDPALTASISCDLITAILEDTDGNLWVGTDGGGLNLLLPGGDSFRTFRSNPRDPATIGFDYIIALLEGRDGSLWIGTSGGGLTRMDRRTHRCQRFQRRGTSPDQISGNYVYAIHEDDAGQLWLGTWGAGVTVFDPATNRFRVYQHDPAKGSSLNHNTILDIFRDTRGNLWFGTLGGGLDRYDPVSDGFVHTTESDGLPNSTVYGILEDSSGHLWMSTNRGIACYNTQARSFLRYGVSDGLQSLEFSQNAFCKGAAGRLYFGGINGVNVIEPARIATSTAIPPVAITQVRVMDREVPMPGSALLDLAPDQNFLSFMFSVLDYTAPEQNSCRYTLEGLDSGWIDAGTRSYAAYTDLQPGDYVFRVNGHNNDNVWNTRGASLHIRVNPPMWKTMWFRTLVLAAMLGLAFGFYRDRVRRMEKEKAAQAGFSRKLNESQESERKRIAGELHDSLGQNLLTIKNRLDRCADAADLDGIRTQLADVSTIVQGAIEEVREISADLHPHMLERLGITRTIDATVKRCASSSGIRIDVHVDPIDGLLSPAQEINVFRIVQEGLNNLVKHSRASRGTVAIRTASGECEITIQDDGCGFIPSTVTDIQDDHGGFGLRHMAERVRLLHGSMDISSSPGNGTLLRVTLTPLHTTGSEAP